MAGGIAVVSNSPVFSPSRRLSPIFCKPSSSSSCHSPSAPSQSPLSLRLHKQQHKLSPSCSTSSSPSSSTNLLKRKRPARIEIPQMTSLAFESSSGQTPKKNDKFDLVEVDGDGYYSVYCKRGKRGPMQDRYSAVINLNGDPKQGIFGVYDGHGGEKAADFVAKNIGKNIVNEVEKIITNDEEGEIEKAVKEGYLTTDAEFLKEESVSGGGGTCCVTALIRNGNVVVSNAGDCRAVVSRGGVAEALTSDHRPSRLDEKERIESLGGYVDFCRGVWRIQGSLAVSRGIGDQHLKKWVIAEPETKIMKIGPDCEFLILASDGLWDKVSNQEAVDVVRPLCSSVERADLVSASKKLAELSLMRGSADDISVVVIQLSQFVP